MEKVKYFIKSHLDFGFYPVIIFPIISAIIIYPCTKFLPPDFGYENGVIENIQMSVLALCFLFALFAKSGKKFFYFIGLIVLLLAAREINYGRTIFFPIPGEVNAYYSWKEIKYGWLANPLIGIYISGCVLYFIFGKVYNQMWNIIKNVKFPVWNFLFLFSGVILALYAEKKELSFVTEEVCELLFYVSLMSIIWLYAFNKKFFSEENSK